MACLALGSLLGLAASSASAQGAPDPLMAWAPAQTEVAVVFRGADGPADLVEYIKGRFGHVPRVAQAADRLMAWSPAPDIVPLARKWGPGLDPGKGAAAFISFGPKIRIVMGVTDPDIARQTATRYLKQLGAPAEVTANGVRVDRGLEFTCDHADGIIACDTEGKPAKGPTPEWLKAAPIPTDGAALLYASGKPLRRMSDGAPLQSIWAGVHRKADRVSFTFEAIPEPFIVKALENFTGPEGNSPVMALIDQSTPFVARVGFDSPTALERVEKLTGSPPPPVSDLWGALKAHWTGELVLAADASLLQPVALMGLRGGPEAGDALMKAIIKVMIAENPEFSIKTADHPRGVKGLRALVLTFDGMDDDRTEVVLPWATVPVKEGHALVLGVSPADIQRRLDGGLKPLSIDAAFASRGTYGFLFPGLPGSWGGFMLYEMLNTTSSAGLLLDGQLMLGVMSELIDEIGLEIRPGPKTIRAEMWWRFL